VRIREQLKSEHDIDIAYSTLTRLLRDQQLRAPKQRSGRYRFEPGEEMQHDTSPHRVVQLQRSYPTKPFLAAIEQALHYGLFDLARLERLILERVAGDFFDLDDDA